MNNNQEKLKKKIMKCCTHKVVPEVPKLNFRAINNSNASNSTKN